MAALRVICTGSREFVDGALAWSVLDSLYARYEPLTLVHGACSMGIDRFAKDRADRCGRSASPVNVGRFPVNRGRYGPRVGGPSATPA